MSGIHTEEIHENIWYSKTINLFHQDDKRLLLHFEGSDFITKVWINGKYVGKNIGGYHRFSFDITNCLVSGTNTFTIKVEDSLSKSQPRGKQRYKHESFKCWYIQTTGIWKTVWLETVPKDYIVSVKTTPNYVEKKLFIELETEISFNQKIINREIHKVDNNIFTFYMNISNSKINHKINFWSPESPNLYDITFKLYYKGSILDEVTSYFGVREISIKNSKIFLNQKELYLKMILDQGYWPESHLTPPSEEAIINDIEIAKKYGYNGIRKHQKIEDERFMYYCDVLGLFVWSEMANCYEFNNKSAEYFLDEWIKVIHQNYNHPSIIAWVPINESWGIPEVRSDVRQQNFVNSLYYVTKALDDTRPVISNDGWEHTLSDIITIHDYKQDAKLLFDEYNDTPLDVLNNRKAYNGIHKLFSGNYKYNGQPVIMSEYGGIALRFEQGCGYGKQVENENEFLERFEGLTDSIQNTNYICGYCYTQLTDVQQEINGLVDEYRKEKFSKEIISKIAIVNQNDRK